ncbi:hypothetical protein K458DRAFT_490827 [Lentithecium fluviatile CBS 122367]|uniref:YWTD domain-containing protein n=1 Tax=Lentithecium fluviatile CBS 122367 TaxID=1168545 RepID=A0A6G1ILQ3_9PLEO|nr:hypothetical protein K458DRAFT_490827 [Lentithecium fluviatile CBS 122367]
MRLSTNLLLASLSFSLAHPNKRVSQGSLYIADEGVGHRSNPVPRWRTSFRRLNPDGTNPTTLQQFGAPDQLESPVGAYALSFDPLARQFYLATGQGIVRTELDGSNPVTILKENSTSVWITSLIVHGEKLWYGTGHEGLLKRANLDGSGMEIFLNVSQGLVNRYGASYTPSYSHADGIAIDDEKGFIYWSAYSNPQDFSAHLPHGGSIRRAPLTPNTTEIEILAQDIWSPGQLRLVRNSTLYWAEAGQYTNSPRALKRAYFPPTKILQPGDAEPETLLDSNTTDLLPYKITSFAIDEKEGEEKVWVVANSDAAIMYGRVLEMGLDGSGLRLVNDNVTQIGVPVGVEYVL